MKLTELSLSGLEAANSLEGDEQVLVIENTQIKQKSVNDVLSGSAGSDSSYLLPESGEVILRPKYSVVRRSHASTSTLILGDGVFPGQTIDVWEKNAGTAVLYSQPYLWTGSDWIKSGFPRQLTESDGSFLSHSFNANGGVDLTDKGSQSGVGIKPSIVIIQEVTADPYVAGGSLVLSIAGTEGAMAENIVVLETLTGKVEEYSLKISTSGATTAKLTTDSNAPAEFAEGSAGEGIFYNQPTVYSSGQVQFMDLTLYATDGTDSAIFRRSLVIDNSIAYLSSATPVADVKTSGFSTLTGPTIAINENSFNIDISVTGLAAKDITWRADLRQKVVY